MVNVKAGTLRTSFIIAIIFFILFTSSFNVFASSANFYGQQVHTSNFDKIIYEGRKLLLDLEKANMVIDMGGTIADSAARIPDKLDKTGAKLKQLGHKFGLIDSDSVIKNANPDDVARIEKILDEKGVTDPQTRKDYIARMALQYESRFGDMGLTGAEEREVLDQALKGYSAREISQELAFLDSKLAMAQQGELEDKIGAVSDLSKYAGEKFENQLMTDMSGYGSDTANLVNNVKNFEDASALEKVGIVDNTLDTLNNFGEGKVDRFELENQIANRLQNGTGAQQVQNRLGQYGQDQAGSGIIFGDGSGSGINPGAGGGVENPGNYTQDEYMKKVEDAGYTKEDMMYIAEKLVPPQYQGAITLAKTVLGMRLIIPGNIQIGAKGNPQYPLAGTQAEYSISAQTTSKIIEPGEGWFGTPTIRDANIQKVTAEVKHDKYPTSKRAIKGAPADSNKVEGLMFRAEPYVQSGKYKLEVKVVDEAFVSNEIKGTVEVRAKDTGLTGEDNPVKEDDGEEENKEVKETYNPEGEGTEISGKEDQSFGFPGFEQVEEAQNVGAKEEENYGNVAPPQNSGNTSSWTNDPGFQLGWGGNSSTNNSGNNSNQQTQNNEEKPQSIKEQLDNSKKEENDKNVLSSAYEKLFGGSSNSNTEGNKDGSNNLYDTFFGEKGGSQSQNTNQNTPQYNAASSSDDKVLKLSPVNRESDYERDKKLADFLKYNKEEIYNRGFNKLSDQDKMVYPTIAKEHNLISDTREFYTNNEVVELPNIIKDKVYEELGDEFIKNQLSMKINGDYKSVISNTYTTLNEGTEEALGKIEMVFKPTKSAFNYDPNEMEIGLAFKGKNDSRNIHYLKVEKKANGYQVYSMNPARSNKINKYWEKIDGFVLNNAEYRELQKGLANQKVN